MTRNPELKDVWLKSWGPLPKFDGKTVEVDTTLPPGLWPNDEEFGDIRVVALFNGTTWLSLIKVPGSASLDDNQVLALRTLGFKEGQDGRLICPSYPTPEIAAITAQILGLDLEPLRKQQIVSLNPVNAFTPIVPIEVQAAIRDLWVNDKEGLVAEIYESLKEVDSLPEYLENHLDRDSDEPPFWLKNPVRLQVWVSQALGGEMGPTTEPILAMGLLKAIRGYGVNPSDWPQDIQDFYSTLREFSGSPGLSDEQSGEVISAGSDKRPALRSEITWFKDGKPMTGLVVGLPDDLDEVWVTPTGESIDVYSRERKGIPSYAPIRVKVSVSDLATDSPDMPDLELGQDELPSSRESAATAEETEGAAITQEPASEASFSSQPPFTLADLMNQSVARKQMINGLPASLETRIALAAKAGGERGMMFMHPLIMRPDTPSRDFVSSWGRVETAFLDSNYSSGEVAADAEVVLRDVLIDQFNEAQPESPNGKPLPMAVLPYGHQMYNINRSDAGLMADVEKIQFCRIGVNPRLIPQISEAMEQYMEYELPTLREHNHEIFSHLQSIAFNFVNQTGLSFDSLSMGSTSTSSQFFRQQFSLKERNFRNEKESELVSEHGASGLDSVEMDRLLAQSWVDHVNSPEGKASIMDGLSGVFPDYQSAGDYINGRSIEQINRLAVKNRAIIASAAEIADVSPATIQNTRHPILVAIEAFEKAAGLNTYDRAESMAQLGIDLSANAHWLGQIMQMNGVSLDMAHRSQLVEHPGEQTEQTARDLGEMTRIRPTVRLEAYSGFITRSGKRVPYQVAILDEKENLFESSKETLRKNAPQIINIQEKALSLGRLADIHHVSQKGLGSALEMDGQLIRPEVVDDLEPAIVGSSDFGKNTSDTLYSSRLGLSALNKARAVGELVDIGTSNATQMQGTLRQNREILLTGTPAFNNDEALIKSVRDSVSLFIADFKPFKSLRNPDRFVDSVMQELLASPNPEMVVLSAKASRSRVRWYTRVVTSGDVEKAGFDRRLAAEQGLLAIKSKGPHVNKTFKHYDVLDLANVLRPEAMRFLNELSKQKQRKEQDENAENTPKVRGARQDRGKVAGLAIKDLRGGRNLILSKLAKASAEDQGKFITKTKLWEAPDWAYLRAPSEEDRNNGARPMEPVVAAIFDQIRKNISAAPPANIPEINQIYARFVLGIRDSFDWIRTDAELKAALQEGGEINELVNTVSSEVKAKGWTFSLILGEDLTPFSPFRDEKNFVFQREYHSHFRKTSNNTEWTIKEAKPGVGRKPSIVTNLEADAEDEELGLTGAMPMLSRLIRTGGEDYRGGIDITEEAVIETFGFSGIEYGKSMNQADRTAYLNHAYDSFLDLSKLLKIPPKALSLGGTLGLAFGSRGRGGRRAAAAHFEPMNNAINLTRMNGAGSMAHEYGHALANYFFRMSRGLQGSRAPGDITKILNGQVISGAEINAGQIRQPVAEAIASVLRSLKYRPVTEEAQVRSESFFVKGARKADFTEGRSDNPYWQTIEELFARGFETFVSVGLKEKVNDCRNDFLVRNDKLSAWGDSPMEAKLKAQKIIKDSEKKWGRFVSAVRANVNGEMGEGPEADAAVNQIMKERRDAERMMDTPILYPSGDERENMKKAFYGLFDVLKTKDAEVQHEHLGRQTMPILYSSASGLFERIGEKDHEVIAACAMEEIARMCGKDVLVKWREEIRMNNEELAAGRYLSKKKASETVKGVIELALNAGLHTAHHEAFHFAQDHLLFDAEQAMLDHYFSQDSELTDRLVSALLKQGRADAIATVLENPREAQAYAYEEWVKGNLDLKIDLAPAGVFGRINSLFTKAADMVTKSGFKTPEQVFMAFYSGQLRVRAENHRNTHTESRRTSQDSVFLDRQSLNVDKSPNDRFEAATDWAFEGGHSDESNTIQFR